MAIAVLVDPDSLMFRTIIEVFAGFILLYLVFTQKRWSTVFLELSVVFAVIDRTMIFIGRDPSILLTHDLLTTMSSIMVLCTVIVRLFEYDSAAKKYKKILNTAIESLVQERKESASSEVNEGDW